VPTVIYLHENAGSDIKLEIKTRVDIGTRIPYLEHYYRMLRFNVVLIAYRGYSDSSGEPTEAGLQLDGESIVNHTLMRNDIDPTKVFVHGRSLGGAVAAYVMTKQLARRVAHLSHTN
jgi:fermentation-respiration switch protein FrsA (DUF1100 family)